MMPRVHVVARFDPLNLLVVLHLQIVELLLERADDLVDLDADGRGIDLDAVVDLRQLPQQRLGDLAIGRDDDLAGLAVDDVQRNFLAQQDVAQRFGQLLAQLLGLLLVLFLNLAWSAASPPRRRSRTFWSASFLAETLTSMTMP